MTVVSDTSPLNYLALIDEIELLPKLFGQVLIPPAVFDELHRAGTPERVREWVDSAPSWLEVRAVTVADLSIKLGRGETEAILLASEIRARQTASGRSCE